MRADVQLADLNPTMPGAESPPPGINIDSFSRTVAQIYDATLSADRWDAALDSLRSLFGSSKAQLSYFYSLSDREPFFRFVGFDAAMMDRMLRKYMLMSLTDPRRPPTAFKPYHCRQTASDSVLHSSEIYQQVLAPLDVEYSLFVVLDFGVDGRCIVSLMRGAAMPPYTAEECEEFGRFVPHISRAISMSATLRRARDIATASHALVDGVPMAMIVLQDERVILTNTAASALLDRGDAVRRVNHGVQAATPAAQAQLALAIAEAHRAHGTVVLTLPAGESGQLRLVLRELDPASAEVLGGGPGALALYLTDSRQPIETQEEVVRRLFGLTEREAAVVCALVRGDDTREIGRRLGIGLETVKTHLKHAMQTVGVRRQAELVGAVVSSPAWIGVESAAAATRRRRGLSTKSVARFGAARVLR